MSIEKLVYVLVVSVMFFLSLCLLFAEHYAASFWWLLFMFFYQKEWESK